MMIKTIILPALCVIFGTTVLAKEKAALPPKAPFNLEELTKNSAGVREKKKATDEPFLSRISGQIAATSKSSLSFRVPGFIEKINKKPGDKIKRGDIIAFLDPGDFELQVKLMKLNKEQALLLEKTAKNELDREQQLRDGNASTASQYDMIKTKYEQARVASQLADVNLKNAERNLEFTKLRAPYDCMLASQYKDKAEHVGLDTKIFDIYEVNSIEVNLNAPEILVGRLDVGAALAISVPSLRYTVDAVVTKVVPAVSETSRTFKVTATLKQTDQRVVPGLFAEAQLK